VHGGEVVVRKRGTAGGIGWLKKGVVFAINSMFWLNCFSLDLTNRMLDIAYT
jgi:hypothetical protein